MARRRFQRPEPSRSGNWWYLLYWQDEIVDGRRERKRKREKLAPAEMPKREVQKIAEKILADQNQGMVPIGSAMKFEDYVTQIYRPTVMPTFAKSTRDRYDSVLNIHLVSRFGQLCLREMTPLTLQKYFSGMADSNLSHESKDKIKDVLSSVLRSAMEFDLLARNPAAGIKLPPPKKGRGVKHFVKPEMFPALLALIQEPYATMVFVALLTGLRVSEVTGLLWRNIHSDSITIEQRISRGDWGPPKSEASNATIPVHSKVIGRIQALKTKTVEVRAGRAIRRYRMVKADGPDDLVFQSVKDGRPMRDNNILVRHLKPAGAKLGIPWVNWLALRRSFATWLKMSGADPKDAQALMRHSKADLTVNLYQQHILESQRQVIERLGRLTESATIN